MGVRYGGGALTRLKWLIHVLMLQWLWSWFALISRLSDIHTLLNLPHNVLISVWNNWFMTSCCNGCGVGLPSFPVSDIYSAYLPHDVLYSSFCDDVLYIILLYRFALNVFPSRNRWIELKLLRAGHRRKGSARWQSKTCPWLIWARLPQRYMARFASRT